jgi:DNA-binding transcriptional regulator YiaG
MVSGQDVTLGDSMKKIKKTKDPLCEAVRKLRTALGESQQAFAYRMKTAIRTVARYETTTPPRGKALAELFWVATDTRNPELANVFRGALVGEIGVVGKFTQLGALASYTVPGIHADLAVMLNDFKYGSGAPETKIAKAIEKLERIVPEMDKLNLYLPKPATAEAGAAGEFGSDKEEQ